MSCALAELRNFDCPFLDDEETDCRTSWCCNPVINKDILEESRRILTEKDTSQSQILFMLEQQSMR